MANQQDEEHLRQGVENWNMWRKEHPDVDIDLSGAYLFDAALSNAYLSDANLSGATLVCANLSGAILICANLSGANLFGATLSNATLSDAHLSTADLSGANLSGANLSGAHLSRANLKDAHLIGADLSRAFLIGADLSNSGLSIAKLSNSDLSHANLSGADLSHAHLNNAIFNQATLSNVNLSGANLSGADFSNVNLSGANLSGADFSNVNLSGANLSGADLSRADLSNSTMWDTVLGELDLRTVKGLETVHHYGPSHLSINTLYLSQGDIPEEFVRETGTPDIFIEYMHALAAKPIEYYTCFISYSSKDHDFAKRLYADLQHKGVRCWFAPEDLKIGDKFRHRIDESIRVHDKLLLVLSEYSVASPWVEKEVETAFEKEQQQNKLVLFPIKLDETVMQTSQAWAADIRRMRHIGDFTHWKDHDAYQRGLTRLLRDLKQDGR